MFNHIFDFLTKISNKCINCISIKVLDEKYKFLRKEEILVKNIMDNSVKNKYRKREQRKK